ncbi:HpcH/HpaI aldolase/citrate lyase family protein [Paraburkholderia lycopersici]|uniref:Citrate lyase subunit beta / citryl-CoA lyase n=1 Tax=Paraburkholderia lycopersici TaxID=416944 RepID=A0A1G7B2Z3_9BURK|nr:CoA ester lyase [Paraburkholderia lycopersici]SDE21217.1 citrate lyase subunit beta / citryl-CoA lyase [Paraburkholderia lycopersici]
MNVTLARSYLFVPGNRPERFEKARSAGADAVIVDLEDAVQPEEKGVARDCALAALDAQRPVWVRVNGTDTPWFADDVAALAAHAGVAGIVLPKAERAEQVAAALARAHAALRVLPIVESARGIAGLNGLCGARGVPRVAFGTLDFQVDMGIDGDGEELDAFRSQIVLASRLAGIAAPVDGVSTVFDDAQALEAEARRGRRFGYGGKLCIHPKQIAPVHRAYAWSDGERAWAQRVLDAVQASAGAAVALDGKMVDMPVILKARRILGV